MVRKAKPDIFFKLGTSQKRDDASDTPKANYSFWGNKKPGQSEALKPPDKGKNKAGSFFELTQHTPRADDTRNQLTDAEIQAFSDDERDTRKVRVSMYWKARHSYGVNYLAGPERLNPSDEAIQELLDGMFRRVETNDILKLYEHEHRRKNIADYAMRTHSKREDDKRSEIYKTDPRKYFELMEADIERLESRKFKHASNEYVEQALAKVLDKMHRGFARDAAKKKKQEAIEKQALEKQRAKQAEIDKRAQEKRAKLEVKAAEKARLAKIRELEEKVKETKATEARNRKKGVRGALFAGSDFYETQLYNFKKYGSTTRPLQYDKKRVERIIQIYQDIHGSDDIFVHMMDM